MAIVPYGNRGSEDDIQFLIEKPGLDVACMRGTIKEDEEDKGGID